MSNIVRLVAKPGVWPRLQAILGANFQPWLEEFRNSISQQAEFMYARKNGEQVFLASLLGNAEFDLTICLRRAREFDNDLVWDIEKVVPREGNPLRSWTEADKIIARMIIPYLSD